MDEKKYSLSVQFTEEQGKLLKQEGKKLGISIGAIIKLAVTDYFQKQGCTT
jgi:hypothetical protein